MDKHAAIELETFITNDRELMLRRLPEFIKNVARKMKRGTYDPVKAIKLWRYLADEGAKKFAQEHGGKWNEMFTVATRNAVAVELERDYAAQIQDGNWSEILAEAKIKLNPSPRGSGVRIVHNKLLGGWYIVRGPHQTPISGRFDTKAEAQAWLNRNNANPAARKKKVAAKKKTATRKKTAAKKKLTARKKVAVGARSRITKKPPTKRLRQRRAKNLTGPAGYFPNPVATRTAKRASASSYIVAAVHPNGDVLGYLGIDRIGVKFSAQKFASRDAARKHAVKASERLPITANVRAMLIVPARMTASAVQKEARNAMGKK